MLFSVQVRMIYKEKLDIMKGFRTMKPDEIVFEVSEETAKVMDSITDNLRSLTEDKLAETSDKLRDTLKNAGLEIKKQLEDFLQKTFQAGNTELKAQLEQMQSDEKGHFTDILNKEESGATQVLDALGKSDKTVAKAHEEEQKLLEEIRSNLKKLDTLSTTINEVRQNQETLLQELQKVENDVAFLKLPYYQRKKIIKEQNAKKLEENGEKR